MISKYRPSDIQLVAYAERLIKHIRVATTQEELDILAYSLQRFIKCCNKYQELPGIRAEVLSTFHRAYNLYVK